MAISANISFLARRSPGLFADFYRAERFLVKRYRLSAASRTTYAGVLTSHHALQC